MPFGAQEEFTRRKKDFEQMEQEASKASHSKVVSEERSNYITTQYERVQVRAEAFCMPVNVRRLIQSSYILSLVYACVLACACVPASSSLPRQMIHFRCISR